MKYKEGDRVRCITPTKPLTVEEGAGWKLGHEFTITSIYRDIYFGGINGGSGVYFS